MLAVDRDADAYLYTQVIHLIDQRISSGELRPGDRLPSLRRLSAGLGVSVPTVKQAYLELERRGTVESRPQSGFYVQAQRRNALVRPLAAAGGFAQPAPVRCRSLIERVHEAIHRPDVVPLGIANPSMAQPAAKALHRTMKRVMARAETRSLGYAPSLGEPQLQRQIAYRYLDLGGRVAPDDVIVTNGGQEALALALLSCAKQGDVIAVESPTYHGMLELIESCGMLAVEIETCPEEGVSLAALANALRSHDIKACMFSAALNNPLGCCTSDDHRRALVGLLEARGIPLIEDDVYGDLLFDGTRPRPGHCFSRKGLVFTCGSFSKTAAPGYRIGWLLPGRYEERARRLKRALSVSSGLLQQLTLTEFIASGDYDRYVRSLRPVLKRNADRMSALIAQHFPDETRVSRPAGGSVLWLELPRRVDAQQLFDRALEQAIAISPGQIYSPQKRYRNHVRLSFGHPWSARMEDAIVRLGRLAAEVGVSA
jgi:DNA-binding transcriptional MocR family regulator